MPKLPIVTSLEAIRAFERLGWTINRRKSSHTTLVKRGSLSVLTVPEKREMPRGTLRTLIRLAGISVEDFIRAL